MREEDASEAYQTNADEANGHEVEEVFVAVVVHRAAPQPGQ